MLELGYPEIYWQHPDWEDKVEMTVYSDNM